MTILHTALGAVAIAAIEKVFGSIEHLKKIYASVQLTDLSGNKYPFLYYCSRPGVCIISKPKLKLKPRVKRDASDQKREESEESKDVQGVLSLKNGEEYWFLCQSGLCKFGDISKVESANDFEVPGIGASEVPLPTLVPTDTSDN